MQQLGQDRSGIDLVFVAAWEAGDVQVGQMQNAHAGALPLGRCWSRSASRRCDLVAPVRRPSGDAGAHESPPYGANGLLYSPIMAEKTRPFGRPS